MQKGAKSHWEILIHKEFVHSAPQRKKKRHCSDKHDMLETSNKDVIQAELLVCMIIINIGINRH